VTNAFPAIRACLLPAFSGGDIERNTRPSIWAIVRFHVVSRRRKFFHIHQNIGFPACVGRARRATFGLFRFQPETGRTSFSFQLSAFQLFRRASFQLFQPNNGVGSDATENSRRPAARAFFPTFS